MERIQSQNLILQSYPVFQKITWGWGIIQASALLVVEISETTLNFDRKTKTGLYAEAGIGEYWIVNLVERCVEVLRGPLNGSYSDIKRMESGEFIEPVARTGVKVAVADLLP